VSRTPTVNPLTTYCKPGIATPQKSADPVGGSSNGRTAEARRNLPFSLLTVGRKRRINRHYCKPGFILALALLLASPAAAGEGGSRHDFRDLREATIRQLSPEGRYCRECHTRPRIKSRDTRPRIPPVPIAGTALLFGTGLTILLVSGKRLRRKA
jgi:hypothetical protein